MDEIRHVICVELKARLHLIKYGDKKTMKLKALAYTQAFEKVNNHQVNKRPKKLSNRKLTNICTNIKWSITIPRMKLMKDASVTSD